MEQQKLRWLDPVHVKLQKQPNCFDSFLTRIIDLELVRKYNNRETSNACQNNCSIGTIRNRIYRYSELAYMDYEHSWKSVHPPWSKASMAYEYLMPFTTFPNTRRHKLIEPIQAIKWEKTITEDCKMEKKIKQSYESLYDLIKIVRTEPYTNIIVPRIRLYQPLHLEADSVDLRLTFGPDRSETSTKKYFDWTSEADIRWETTNHTAYASREILDFELKRNSKKIIGGN